MATVFFVVCFAYIFALSPTAHAADAEWKSGSIVYQQNTYTGPVEAKGNESHKVPVGAQIYTYTEPSNSANGGSTQKAHLIYFPSGTDPATATTASYQTFDLLTWANLYSNPSQVKQISLTPPPAAAAANPGTTSCALEGIGWIVCPVTNFLAKGMDLIYGWVAGFLEVAPLATSQDQALYRAWGYMRTFANLAFIIAFLVIIYSQITNVGLSNYDIKKMLPRIVIAAILVNTSYWICAVAVDLFNILGYSVQDLFLMIRNSLVGNEGNSWKVVSWESMSALVLSGGSALGGASIATYLGITGGALAVTGAAGVGAVVSGLIFLVLPLLISVLFVVLMTFLILAARQAIITILIIIAPLAFVAFLLPNTEKWFEKWRSTFFTLLLVFPAFSLIFGGSQLAAAAIIQNAQGASALNMIILAMGVQVIPLAITPILLKLGGGVLNRFAGIVNNPTKGIFDRGKNWARERTEHNKARGLAHLDERAKQRGFHNGRPTAGSWRQRTRLNPNNMAYLREYNRRERTGMKSANEAMSESMFVQTAAGRRIHDRTKDAGLEKHFGESTNLEAYNNAVYGTPGIPGSGDPYRQHLHHGAHTSSGRAKLVEDRATAHAERDLQTQISSTAALRDLKIQTDVDTAHAQFQAANVTAEGKAVFKREFDDGAVGGRALRMMNVQTSNFEKEAASIDTMLTKRADADWERLSTSDANFQRRRLKEVEASEAFTRAEKQWQRTLTEIKDKGSAAPGILNPGDAEISAMTDAIRTDVDASVGLDKAISAIQTSTQSRSERRFVKSREGRRLNTDSQAAQDSLEAAKLEEAAIVQERRTKEGAKGLTGEQKRIADELREADIQKRAQTQRTTAATGQANLEYAGSVKNDETIPGGTESIATVAGGVAGAAGVSQANATATQVLFDTFDKAIAAEKTLVSRNKPDEILGKGIEDPNTGKISMGLGHEDILDEPEERIAALAGKVSGDSHHESKIKLWQRMGELGRQANKELEEAEASGNPARIKDAQDKVGKVKSLEQQVYGDKNKLPFGVGEVDAGDAKVGKYTNDVYHQTRKRIHSHMSAQVLATMDQDDLRLIFEMARAGKLSKTEFKKVNKAYRDWQKDDNLKASLQPKHRDLLEPIRKEAEKGERAYPQPNPDIPEDEFDFWRDKYPVDSMKPAKNDPKQY